MTYGGIVFGVLLVEGQNYARCWFEFKRDGNPRWRRLRGMTFMRIGAALSIVYVQAVLFSRTLANAPLSWRVAAAVGLYTVYLVAAMMILKDDVSLETAARNRKRRKEDMGA